MHREDAPPALGRLKNGNPSGNPTPHRAAARAIAPAMPRTGDGERPLSQPRRQEHRGPTTAAGRERLRTARTAHGCHGAEGREFRAAVADLLAQGRRLRLIRALRTHATG